MGLLSKMIEDGKEWYRMGNLYFGYVCTNIDVEDLDEENCTVTYLRQPKSPIICYKPTLSKIYTRVSNDMKYLESTIENNSQEVGDSYFKITSRFIDFTHKYLVNFDKYTNKDYIDKQTIIKLEDFLAEKVLEIQSQDKQDQSLNK